MGRIYGFISDGNFRAGAKSLPYPAIRRLGAACIFMWGLAASAILFSFIALGADQKDKAASLSSYHNARPIVEWSDGEVVRKMPELRGMEPAQNQEPLPDILRKVGEKVQAFFHNLISTASVEDIHQERTGINNSASLNSMRLNYLLLASPDQKGPGLREYRTDSRGKPAVLRSKSGKFILTSGFAAVSIYFDPKYQANSQFRFLGKKMVNDREILLVAFAQRPDPKYSLGGFTSLEGSVPVLVQGLAWIDPADFQIVRMRTDLLEPQNKVSLERLTTDVTFREVRFKGSQAAMWLPREVDVTVIYQYTTYRNQHLYSDYKLFNVEAGSKAGGKASDRSPE
ncbi:MAG TPA: hypothetical protein VG028_21840 [Terriglobia bacterium]|nr:hypothetical protein [Terriglobia bacterium]